MQCIAMQTQIIKTLKTMIKMKIYHILCKQMQIINMVGKCLKKYLYMILSRKNLSKYIEKFIKNIMKIVVKDMFLK